MHRVPQARHPEDIEKRRVGTGRQLLGAAHEGADTVTVVCARHQAAALTLRRPEEVRAGYGPH